MGGREVGIVIGTEILINQGLTGEIDQRQIGKVIHLTVNKHKEMDAILGLHRTTRRKVHPKIMVPQGLEKGEILYL